MAVDNDLKLPHGPGYMNVIEKCSPEAIVTFEVGASKELFTVNRFKLALQSKYFARIQEQTEPQYSLTVSVPIGCPDAFRIFQRWLYNYSDDQGLISKECNNPDALRPLMSLVLLASEYEMIDLHCEALCGIEIIIAYMNGKDLKPVLQVLTQNEGVGNKAVDRLMKDVRNAVARRLSEMNLEVVGAMSDRGFLPKGLMAEVLILLRDGPGKV